MLQSALRTLATRSHASVAASSRALLRPRAPRIAPVQRFSSAAYGTRGANPLAPEEGEEDEVDEHDEQPHHDMLQQAEEEVMPTSREEHLPVNWPFYQSILGQPVVNTYHALRTVGYDAPWELFVRYCDASGGKYRAVLKAMDVKAEDNFKARMKAGFKGSEGMYLNDCWKVLMQQRKAEQGVELGEADKPSVLGFTGGSWREWNTLRLRGRDDGKIQVRESRRKVVPGQEDANESGFTTLLPPTPGEKNRWFTIQRPAAATKSTQSAASQDQTGAEEPDASNAGAAQGSSQKGNRLQLHRVVRLPSLPPGTNIGSSRIYFPDLDWSDESVDKKEVALMFDKDAQEMHLIERTPGVEDGEWKLAAPPVTLDSLAQIQHSTAIMELARDQGLLDVERWEKAVLLHKLKQGLDTLDLATNISRGLKYTTYPVRTNARQSAELRLRVQLADPTDPGKTHICHPHSTIFPTHMPDLFAARLAGQMRKNKTIERILERKDPNDPPELRDFTEDGGLEILPYISTAGATPAEQGWEVDVSTPNRDANPPTAIPPFPEPTTSDSAQPPSSSTSNSTSPSSSSSLPSSPASKPDEALILRSASPETLRLWSYGIGQDVSFLPRVTSWTGGFYSAWTGEQVKERMPVLWTWAKRRGHWKEIPEKE